MLFGRAAKVRAAETAAVVAASTSRSWGLSAGRGYRASEILVSYLCLRNSQVEGCGYSPRRTRSARDQRRARRPVGGRAAPVPTELVDMWQIVTTIARVPSPECEVFLTNICCSCRQLRFHGLSDPQPDPVPLQFQRTRPCFAGADRHRACRHAARTTVTSGSSPLPRRAPGAGDARRYPPYAATGPPLGCVVLWSPRGCPSRAGATSTIAARLWRRSRPIGDATLTSWAGVIGDRPADSRRNISSMSCVRISHRTGPRPPICGSGLYGSLAPSDRGVRHGQLRL